jgi:hypothetical protein
MFFLLNTYVVYKDYVQPYIKNELDNKYPVFEFVCLFIHTELARNVLLMSQVFVSLVRLMVKVAIEDLFVGYHLH